MSQDNKHTTHFLTLQPTFQDDFLAGLLQGLDGLVVCDVPQVVAVDREDGIAHVQGLSLIGREPFENLGDENGHLVLLPS